MLYFTRAIAKHGNQRIKHAKVFFLAVIKNYDNIHSRNTKECLLIVEATDMFMPRKTNNVLHLLAAGFKSEPFNLLLRGAIN